MKKILFVGTGSKNDPGFDDIKFSFQDSEDRFQYDINYKEYMENKGITVIDNLVESCHGCPDIMTNYSIQMQSLVEDGNKVVAVLEGGLLFALPSIQATQVTFPIISCPIDLVAYQAFFVPSGHAAIAGMGMDGDNNDQKVKALTLAERILNLDNEEVVIIEDASNGNLSKELDKYDIKHYKVSDKDERSYLGKIVLAYNNYESEIKNPISMLIRADSDENLKDWRYLQEAEARHHNRNNADIPTAQLRGLSNLAIYAAKILSLQRPELRTTLLGIASEKHKRYKQRNLRGEI